MTGPVTTDLLQKSYSDVVSKLSDEALEQLIDQAQTIAELDGFPETVKINGQVKYVLNMATLDMTLHLASITTGSVGKGLTAEKVGALEKHFTDTTNKGWLGLSPWGKAYLWLYSRFGSGKAPRIAVIQH